MATKNIESAARLLSNQSLQVYFDAALRELSERRGLSLSTDAHAYLAGMLASLGHRRGVQRGALSLLDTPLVFLWKRALEAPPTRRVAYFRDLGDAALALGGFFVEHLRRRMVGVDYCVSFGRNAYGAAAFALRTGLGFRARSALFEELADEFPRIVSVVQDLATRQTFDRQRDVVRLLRRWAAGDKGIGAHLLRHGVTVLAGSGVN